jgi:hypothetical protein
MHVPLPAPLALAADLHAALHNARDAAQACRRGPLYAVPGAAAALRDAAERLGLVLLAALEQGDSVLFDADGGVRIASDVLDAPLDEASDHAVAVAEFVVEAAANPQPAHPVVTALLTEGSESVVPLRAGGLPSATPPAGLESGPTEERAIIVSRPRTTWRPPTALASPPASSVSLRALASRGLHEQVATAAPAPVTAQPAAFEFAQPRAVAADTAAAALAELQRACASFGAWRLHPQPTQRAALAYVAARLRQLQDEVVGLTSEVHAGIERLFPALTRYSDTERPGFVYGLSRNHTPRGTSWLDDAGRGWRELPGTVGDTPQAALAAVEAVLEGDGDSDELRAAVLVAWETNDAEVRAALGVRLVGHSDRLQGKKALKTLRAHLQDREQADADATEAGDAASPIPEDWAWSAITKSARVLLAGGDRPAATRRLNAAFGFDHITHVTGHQIRKVQSAAEQVKGVNLVIVIVRFLSHRASGIVIEACRDIGTPYVIVGAGTSIAQVRRAIEEQVAAPIVEC